MSVLKRKIYTLFHTPRIFWKKFAGSPIFRLLPDRLALKIQYRNVFGKKLNLKNPETFNEKLQWLKLYNRRPEYTKMVDKYEAKKYVASIIGEEHIIPTLGVYDSFDEIDFDTLPEQFVLKCTHGSGDVIICRDKKAFDKDTARKKLTKALKTDYYKISREWPYKNVPRRIIAEEYMSDNASIGLNDYKFMCFNGKVECSFVCTNRFSQKPLKITFYDLDWNKMPVERDDPSEDTLLPKPISYEKMLCFAEKISAFIPFSRIDFYEIGGKVYFGEITFFPGGGMKKFQPAEWDKKFGNMIILPEKHIDR